MATLPPEEIEYEFVHWNDDKGPSVIVVTTIFIVFALSAVVLRLITRKAIVRISWQVDDYAIVAAIVRLFRIPGNRVVDTLNRYWPWDFTLSVFCVGDREMSGEAVQAC